MAPRSSRSPKVRKKAKHKHPAAFLVTPPRYATSLGAAYVGDSLDLMKDIPARSVDAIVTSPPYALRSKKSYGNADQHAYIDWFLRFVPEFRRVLKPKGSLVLEIGGAWNPGQPTRSIYHFELLVRLVNNGGFHLAEEFYWFNRARMPGPTEWVNVKRIRVKDAVTPIWWLSLSPRPNANNRTVLTPYSNDMLRLFKKGYNRGRRPSGHVARAFERNNGGAIPPNLIEVAHTHSVDGYQDYCRKQEFTPHPARFPRQVPEFFVKFLTRKGGLVLDPFSGSNMTGYVAEKLGRRWISFDKEKDYVSGSLGRFLEDKTVAAHVIRGDQIRKLPHKKGFRSSVGTRRADEGVWVTVPSQLPPFLVRSV
jgi:DNA modification methylase